MHLVVHAPFGSRLNRAWGLSLRKRFCQTFNFELQAAATEDAIVLSLGPTHSFPLEDAFRFLHSNTVRDVLIQAVLDAPLFGVRWRWNASRALAIPRAAGRPPAAARRYCARRPRTSWPWSSPISSPAWRTSWASARSRTIRWSSRPSATAWRRPWTSRGWSACCGGWRPEKSSWWPATWSSPRPWLTRSSRPSRTPSSTTLRWRSAGPRRWPCAAGSIRRPPRTWARSTRRPSRGCARRRGPRPRPRTSCTTPC